MEAEEGLPIDFVGAMVHVQDRGTRGPPPVVQPSRAFPVLFFVHIIQGTRRRLRVSIRGFRIWKAPDYKICV